MNNVTLIGRLTKEPELKYVGNGQIAVAEFTLAINRNYKDTENSTDFIPIQVWNKTAENCVKYLNKGSLIGISGKIRVDKYKNKDGHNNYMTKVVANSVRFLDSKQNDTSNKNNKYYDSNELFEDVNTEIDSENIELPF